MNHSTLCLLLLAAAPAHADKVSLPKLDLGPECNVEMGSPQVFKEKAQGSSRVRTVTQACASNGAANQIGCYQGMITWVIEYPHKGTGNGVVKQRKFEKFPSPFDCEKIARCRALLQNPSAPEKEKKACFNELINFTNASRGGAGGE